MGGSGGTRRGIATPSSSHDGAPSAAAPLCSQGTGDAAPPRLYDTEATARAVLAVDVSGNRSASGAQEPPMLGPPKLRCLDRPVAVSLEALVPPDDFYRHLDAKLDLGFVRDVVHDRYADGGRPSIDPVVFFKLQLVLFFEGIRSERQLIATASLHLAHRWYLGYHLDEPLPDHSSLTRIRERYGLAVFRRFFERVVELCQEAGLVWGKELFFDATKVRANAAVDSLRPRLHQVAREHLEELFAPDALEPAEPGAAPAAASAADSAKNAERPAAVTPTPLRPPDAHAARTAGTTGEPARWELLEQCRLDPDRPPVGSYRRTTDVRASTTDPDAAPMSNGGKIVLGYHDHCVVDGGRKRIILYALVTPADVMENRPMLDLLRRVRFRWRLRPKRAIGDTTYGTVQNIRALEDEGIRAYVPLPDFDQRTPFYGASRFTYDAERDAYRCPQGRPLRRWKAKHTEEVVIYRADAATCTACPVRAACTSSAHGRQVRRSFHAAYLERVKAYHGTPGYQKAMRKRKIWVEPLFGEAKEWHGLRRFRLRGLQKVNTEGLLIAAGQNLKRWLAATGWGRRHGPCGSLFPARTGDGARCRTRSRAARHRPVAGRPTPGFSTRSPTYRTPGIGDGGGRLVIDPRAVKDFEEWRTGLLVATAAAVEHLLRKEQQDLERPPAESGEAQAADPRALELARVRSLLDGLAAARSRVRQPGVRLLPPR
jgi:transposase